MPTGGKPRNLKDVSHLFLSGGGSGGRRGVTTEAVLWLVSLGPGSNRAFVASGCAAAAASKSVHVTLLEIGRGLPNIGYYLSLDPQEYAAPSVDPSRFLAGSSGPYLRYVSAAGTEPIGRYDPPPVGIDSPLLLLAALEGDVEHRVIENIGARWLPEHGGRPEALCCFGGPDDRAERGGMLEGLRGEYPDAFLLDLADERTARGREVADETLVVPERLAESWSKRFLPHDPFFDDVVSNVLQVLSHRRRRTEDRATI